MCNSPTDGMDRQTEMCLYSLPSVLATFQWCLECSFVYTHHCSRQRGGLGGAWQMCDILLLATARGCCDLSSQHVLQGEELVCTLLLKDYPQYSIAGWIYLSPHALVTAICLADSSAVPVPTVTMTGLWIRGHDFITCL